DTNSTQLGIAQLGVAQAGLGAAAATTINQQNSVLASFMASLSKQAQDLQSVISGFTTAAQPGMQNVQGTQEAIANQDLLQRLFTGANSTGEQIQSLADYAAIIAPLQASGSPGTPRFFTSPAFSAPASPGGAANSNIAAPDTQRIIEATY